MEVKNMDIGEIISDSIKYPTSDWVKVLVLGVIFLISFLIIPIFIAYGYIFRMIKATLAGLDELPEFDEIGEMFVDGLKILVVGIVYAIPVIIIGLIVNLIFGSFSSTTTTDLSAGMFWALMIGNIVYFIVALIVGLIAIMAIANMAYYNGDLGAAFRFGEILDYISRIGWGKYLVVYIVVAIIGIIIYLVAAFIGLLLLVVGIIITLPLAAAFISMFGSRAIALLFIDAVAEVPESPTEPVDPIEPAE
jgi:hypothetical protein